MAQVQAVESTKQKTARAVVARGRSIDVPTGGEPIAVGATPEGKPVSRGPVKQYGPGQEVELPIDEIKTLRGLGYLVDPDRVAPASGNGPQFSSEGPGQVSAI
jgi:hypothetical protein